MKGVSTLEQMMYVNNKRTYQEKWYREGIDDKVINKLHYIGSNIYMDIEKDRLYEKKSLIGLGTHYIPIQYKN